MVLLLFAANMMAQQLTEKEAKQRAMDFLNKSNRAKGFNQGARQLRSVKSSMSRLYAFNVDGGGYVIASGDSRTLPILGYSDEGELDFNNMPANMQAWLKGYETAIAALGDATDLGSQEQPAANRAAVEPMLKTLWYQTFPYNNLCPVFDGNLNPKWEGQRGVTGCVATAMAMLMKFHEWPKEECKAIPAYTFSYSADNVTSENMTLEELPPVKFDWANMLDRYSLDASTSTDTEVQQNAVAKLMQYCGQAVHMGYTPDESGAQSVFIAKALVQYFDYDRNLRYVSRAFYGIDEWEDMIYGELSQGRPVFYGGFTDTGGHAFTCDGYDGEGLFHINWGWNGHNDGYFLLSVLNPYDTQSVGSSSSSLGFCIDQDAILGIKPAEPGSPEAEDKPYIELARDIEYDDEKQLLAICINHQWLKNDKINVEMALCSIDDEGKLVEHYVSMPGTIDSKYYNTLTVPLADINLQENVPTKLYPVVRSTENGLTEWVRLTPDSKYILAERDGEETSIRLMPELNMEIVDAKLSVEPACPLENNWLNLQIKNNGEEFSGEMNVTAVYIGDAGLDDLGNIEINDNFEQMSVGAYLRKGSTTDVSLPFTPATNGNVALLISRGSEEPVAAYLIKVTGEFKGFYDLEVTDYTIEYPENDIYIKVNLKIKNNDENDWNSNSNAALGIYKMLEFRLDDPEALEPGETTPVNFLSIASGETVEIDDNKDYIDIMPMAKSVTLYFDQVIGKNRKNLLTVPLTEGSTATGVNTINTDSNADDNCYTLKGIRIATPKRAGVYIKNKKTLLIK